MTEKRDVFLKIRLTKKELERLNEAVAYACERKLVRSRSDFVRRAIFSHVYNFSLAKKIQEELE